MAKKNNKYGRRNNNNNTRNRNNTCKRESEERVSPTNDVEFYANNPQLLRDAASIPYSQAIGTTADLENALSKWADNDSYTAPGICRLDVIPSVGFAKTASDPINVASNKLYTFVRHANSGHSNYDAPDLMLYIVAIANAYSFVNWAQRLYGCVNVWANMNRYYGQALVEAMGVSYDSIRDNLANFRYGLNALIMKVATFAVPANFSYFKKLAQSYAGYYSEGENIKDQLYFMNPFGLSWYKFGLDDLGAGKLTLSSIATHAPGVAYWDDIIKFGNDLIAPLIMSEDMNIMSGDILKAYGDNIFKLVTIPEEYTVLPSVDINVLEQFKNSTPIGVDVYTALKSTAIVQDATRGFLTCDLTANIKINDEIVDGYKAALHTKHIVTTIREASPEITMEITRYQVGAQLTHLETTSYELELHPGAELPIGVMYFGTPSTSLAASPFGYGIAVNTVGSNVADFFNYIASMSAFKFHPDFALYVFSKPTQGASTAIGIKHLFDVDNYALVDENILTKMHETALLSMLNVNGVATYTN